MIGSQVSQSQFEKISRHINICKEDLAEVLAVGSAGNYEGHMSNG